MNNRLRNILLGIGVSLFSQPTFAETGTTDVPVESHEVQKVVDESEAKEAKIENEERESLFPNATRDLGASHFTWGAEFGASIDMSDCNTSTFNIDAVLGYKNSYFRILGAGVGIHKSLGNGDSFIPVYALLRTSFSNKPKLLFMSLKLGYSFNTIGDSPTFGDVNSQLGLGINLAMGKKFQSHIVLAYEFRHFNARNKAIINEDYNNISFATVSFGVNF